MKAESRAKELSDAIERTIIDWHQDHRVPDKEDRNNKAADLFLPSLDVLIEFKSISPDFWGDAKSFGQKLNSAKKDKARVFGTVHIEFDDKEFVRFSDRMTGKLRAEIADADKKLGNFQSEDQVLRTCCVVVEVEDAKSYDWERNYLPTKDMVRRSADLEFKKRRFDALAMVTLNPQKQVWIDIVQKVYSGGELEGQFNAFAWTLAKAIKSVNYPLDLSEPPAIYFEPG